MSHLSPEQLTELKTELERQLGRLRRSMKVSDEALRPVELDQTAVGRLSRIDSLQNQSMTRSLHQREEVRLAHIQGALMRFDSGTYGRCVECDSPVPFARLFVFPEAPTCQACG
jgi:DnaK suppressor protein